MKTSNITFSLSALLLINVLRFGLVGADEGVGLEVNDNVEWSGSDGSYGLADGVNANLSELDGVHADELRRTYGLKANLGEPNVNFYLTRVDRRGCNISYEPDTACTSEVHTVHLRLRRDLITNDGPGRTCRCADIGYKRCTDNTRYCV